jgi:hypothetical protein
VVLERRDNPCALSPLLSRGARPSSARVKGGSHRSMVSGPARRVSHFRQMPTILRQELWCLGKPRVCSGSASRPFLESSPSVLVSAPVNAPGLKRKRLTTVALQSSGRVSEPFFGASLGGCLSGLAPEGDRPPHRGREGPGAARSSVSQSADFGRSCCKTAQPRGTLAWSSPRSADRPVSGSTRSGSTGSARRRTPASSWS